MATLKQRAWSTIREEKNLQFNNGVSSRISSSDIKNLAGEEPRLVCSIDSKSKLPEALSKDQLFVLPVDNGGYKLVEGEGYHVLEPIQEDTVTHESTIPFDLVTTTGQSEDRYVKYAYNTGLISRFTGINQLFQGISSRKYSNEFTFYVGESGPITAEGVQFQVDGLFEGKSSIVVMEAKADDRDDFLIRQLYYPYRHYGDNSEKSVKSLFFLYDGQQDTYNFWEYSFKDPEDYASIELERSRSYEIEKTEAEVEEFADVEKKEEGRWEIPQADDIQKIQQFPFLVDRGLTDYESIAEYFNFETRQSNYYREATEIIGLVSLEDGEYSLTDRGKEFIELRPDERNKRLLKMVLQVPIMNEVFQRIVEKFGDEDPHVTKEEIADIIENNSHLSGATPKRRARTILSWFDWISKNAGVVRVDNNGIRLYL